MDPICCQDLAVGAVCPPAYSQADTMATFIYRNRHLVLAGLATALLIYVASVLDPRVRSVMEPRVRSIMEPAVRREMEPGVGSVVEAREEIMEIETEEETDELTEEESEEQEDSSVSMAGSPMRDCVTWKPLDPAPSLPQNQSVPEWIKKKTNKTSESRKHRKDSFAWIWDKLVWGTVSRSGSGSLLTSTASVRNILSVLVDKIKSDLGKDKVSLLDSSCGDMNWMPTFLHNRSDILFTGYDIVPGNIDNHRKNFADKPWTFVVRDIVVDPISKHDIILSRVTLQHLTNGDIKAVLYNFLHSGSNFLLTTNFDLIKANVELDVEGGRYRPVNLLLPPYNLPHPVCSSWDDCGTADVYIGLWDLRALASMS